MKKSIVASVILLTLAGCSASAVYADPFAKNESAKTTKSVTYKKVPSSIQTRESFVQNHKLQLQKIAKAKKLQRNKAKMTKVVDYLKTRVEETPYVYSGSSPNGWDCSGMVRWTYERFGMELPHSANKQAHVGERVSSPRIGDIVVFAYRGSTSFYHSAIYIGNGKIVNANSYYGRTVIEPLSNYKNSQIRFVRVVPQPEAKSTPVL